MSKALQVYDKIEEKVVDIPEDEAESVQNTRRIYFWHSTEGLRGKHSRNCRQHFSPELYHWTPAVWKMAS